MKGLAVIGLVLLALVIAAAVLILATWIVVWNLTDIQNVGVNFWNVFWLVVVFAGLAGGAGKAARE